jgi:hypothetical protein
VAGLMSGLTSIDGRFAIWLSTHRVSWLNDPFVWLGTIEKLGAVWVLFAIVTGVRIRYGFLRTARWHSSPGSPSPGRRSSRIWSRALHRHCSLRRR